MHTLLEELISEYPEEQHQAINKEHRTIVGTLSVELHEHCKTHPSSYIAKCSLDGEGN
jgi:hypothetical protein